MVDVFFAIKWLPQHIIDYKSTLVQVMAWCCQATSHYLSQYWPRSMWRLIVAICSVGNSHRPASPRPTTLEEDRKLFVDFSSILCLRFETQAMRTYNFFDWVSNTGHMAISPHRMKLTHLPQHNINEILQVIFQKWFSWMGIFKIFIRVQLKINYMVYFTLKHRETHGCIVRTVATDALVLKHQAISIHNAE